MPINIAGFRGMANVDTGVKASLTDQSGIAATRLVLNADVRSNGTITPRSGYTKRISLTDPHSLYAGNGVMLCVYQGAGGKQTLARIYAEGRYEDLAVIPGTKCPMFYSGEGEGLLYISNKFWTGVLDNGVIREWGVSVPTKAPTVTLIDGTFPAGSYLFTYTRVSADGRMSGNGPVSGVNLLSGEKGFHITNPATDLILWITDVNTGNFFYAGESALIDFKGDSLSPLDLPSFNVSPPPPMKCILSYGGRMWGVSGKSVLYSMPLAMEWFRPRDRIVLPAEPDMMAEIKDGIYVHCRGDRSLLLVGKNPDEMKIEELASTDGEGGAIPGTLIYRDVQESGQEIPIWRHKTELPVWLTKTKGVCAGNQHGRIVSLSEVRIQWDPAEFGAGLYRTIRGEPQMIFTMPLHLGEADPLASRGFKNGTVL